MHTNLAGIALTLTCAVAAASAQGPGVGPRTGVAASAELPAEVLGAERVFLRVPHIRQEPELCVPTSAAMVLAYYGDGRAPRELKVRSRGADYDPSAPFEDFTITWWRDLIAGMQPLGYRWRQRGFANTAAGFEQGLEAIRVSLRRGDPVLVDVKLFGSHTFVVAGFDDARAEVSIIDPNLPEPGLRVLSYAQLASIWNGLSYDADLRPTLFTGRRRSDSGIERGVQ